jgi:hypothetical protein
MVLLLITLISSLRPIELRKRNSKIINEKVSESPIKTKADSNVPSCNGSPTKNLKGCKDAYTSANTLLTTKRRYKPKELPEKNISKINGEKFGIEFKTAILDAVNLFIEKCPAKACNDATAGCNSLLKTAIADANLKTTLGASFANKCNPGEDTWSDTPVCGNNAPTENLQGCADAYTAIKTLLTAQRLSEAKNSPNISLKASDIYFKSAILDGINSFIALCPVTVCEDATAGCNFLLKESIEEDNLKTSLATSFASKCNPEKESDDDKKGNSGRLSTKPSILMILICLCLGKIYF